MLIVIEFMIDLLVFSVALTTNDTRRGPRGTVIHETEAEPITLSDESSDTVAPVASSTQRDPAVPTSEYQSQTAPRFEHPAFSIPPWVGLFILFLCYFPGCT